MSRVSIERRDSARSTTIHIKGGTAEVFVRVTPSGRVIGVYIDEGKAGEKVTWTIRRKNGEWVQS